MAYFWKGEALIKKGVYKTAIKSFTRYLSLAAIIEDLPFESSIVAAHYNLGYCYLKEDNFSSALTYFQKSTKLAEQSKVQYKSHKLYNLVYSDAVIRSADCHFMLNNYNNALTNYFRVVNNNFPGADYSLYQIGVLYGLANNDAKKISNLERLLTEHRKSLFVDDALFELGNTYLVSDDRTAIKYYNRILSDHPQSTYVSKALLQLGSAYLNLEDNDKALEYYTQVVTEYSATPEAQVALLGVWDIAISTSDPQIYIDLLESVPGMNITISAEDSINYHAAEMRYRKGDCENAVKDLTNYINKFPNGFFANNAHFYRGECLFNDNDFLGALKDYEYVADQVRNRFSENALLKVASIYFYKMTDYKHAFENYLQLLYIADYRANSLTALVGLMRSAYHLKEHEDVVKYATQILDFSQATQMDIAEANLYLGKTAMETGDYEAAIVNFTKTAESTTTEFGVEARYLIALVQYRRLEYKASQATCFIIINHIPSYEELVIKSFILLADNYLALGEVFQAKATLQSIIDNYQGEELKQVAIDKLNAILEKERQEAEEIDTGEDDNFIYEEDSIYFEPDSLYFNFEGIEIDNDSTETDDD
ncbi:MAG: tetratricopeptide repeat protein [Bacteroidetes bacterium]|nr:tetratricopeptide repeat protein [Bacteroidota bacterium]